jgi:hypothetical protein
MKQSFLLVLVLLLFAMLLSACSGGQHPAAASVEAFLKALVRKDEAQMVTLTCEAYETEALLEYDAFSLVQTRLEGLDCQVDNVAGDTATVVCQGAIFATYGMEDQEFDLTGRKYQVVQRGGEWLVCGQ